MKLFRADNTDHENIDDLNAEWAARVQELNLEPNTDEYDFQAKCFADEVARR